MQGGRTQERAAAHSRCLFLLSSLPTVLLFKLFQGVHFSVNMSQRGPRVQLRPGLTHSILRAKALEDLTDVARCPEQGRECHCAAGRSCICSEIPQLRMLKALWMGWRAGKESLINRNAGRGVSSTTPGSCCPSINK